MRRLDLDATRHVVPAQAVTTVSGFSGMSLIAVPQ